MPAMDKIGRNLHEGQLVDVCLNGMYTAGVVKIIDSNLIMADGSKSPPMLIVSVMLQLPIVQNRCNYVYVVKSAPKEAEPQAENVIKFPVLGE